MRRLLPLLAAAAVVAAVVIGLTQSGGEDSGAQDRAGTFDLNAAKERLRGAPAPLAALHDQSSRLLDGGKRAFADRLAELEGHPVVVNKWASWCGPCRFEFPVFQRVATARGREVAFVGLDARDNRDEAAEFLSEFPVPFPSYVDPEEEIARDIGAPANYPITLFYDRRGRRAFVHQGPYRSDADLSADIDRYTG
jgi:cytochrome c biogenesis protein CcmG/thiol:disulfide interchange protein DsbE